MTEPQLHHVLCPDANASRRMAYWQWGDAASSHVVLCVHGLTRQGRDFDVLASDLLAQAGQRGRSLRVVSVDVAGRGHSDWLPDASHYQPLTYLADLQALMKQLQAQAPVAHFDWVGTSMGGIIGMLAAAQPQAWPAPIGRLVLNDVGPALQWAGLERIRGYVGQVGPFGSLGEGVYYLRGRLAGFGPHSDAQWTALNAPMFRPALREAPQASAVVLHYDPAIGRPFEALTPEASAQSAEAMRAVYRQLACQTLLLRGAQSELLSREVALEMTITGPKARLVEFAGVGHAPTLVAADQVQVVREFLLGD
jgi:pimeloyl-ACP methyl ester carboxylesterase